MSSPAILLADLAAALERPVSPWTPCTLSVLTAEPTPDELAGLLAGLSTEANGWLCLTDRVLECSGGAWRQVAPSPEAQEVPDAAACARVLSGEFVLTDTSSLHLRRVGATLTSYRYVDGPAAPRAGESVQIQSGAVLFEDVSFVSTERTERGSRRLTYRSYHAQGAPIGGPPVATWQPLLSRFIGWEDPR
ncbi:MAG: hypothetical protein ABIO70_14480 [Pseudomonadota bacterium]